MSLKNLSTNEICSWWNRQTIWHVLPLSAPTLAYRWLSHVSTGQARSSLVTNRSSWWQTLIRPTLSVLDFIASELLIVIDNFTMHRCLRQSTTHSCREEIFKIIKTILTYLDKQWRKARLRSGGIVYLYTLVVVHWGYHRVNTRSHWLLSWRTWRTHILIGLRCSESAKCSQN